ncbi:esterase [Shinella sumterensis]|uniref:alpha/beta hydrolase n=1 Tax=Shinella sumterensis TaxID=1967501 RepID=UPI00106EC9F6|nr:alpha/beta hydrolase [Shinella sumterensis]MCD1265408.1 alpha/beta hydrolase fold domain-containing protein [Shinella sumterensis]TFE93227.1 esterase [Shinella sumterensis]
MNIAPHYSDEEIELQYNLRVGRPDYDTVVVSDWIERSEEARKSLDCRLDIAYGVGTKQKLDVFYARSTDAPTLIFFHGGYWQRGDKSVYSFLASPFVANGVNVILVGYHLCPEVSITAISVQAREALAWIWKNADELMIDRLKLTVMGHSAGGHITAMLMGTDWRTLAPDLPLDLVKAGIPVSPLNALEPIRRTSLNIAVGMDAAEAEAESPMNHPPVTDAPQLVVCGGRETAEFHRQSDIYVAAFATATRPMERYSVPDCDHFDELNALADTSSPFFKKSLALIKAAGKQE